MGKAVLVGIFFWACMAGAWRVATIVATPAPLTANQKVRVSNLGNLPFYREANLALGQGPDRVVFFGDSITNQWNLWESFHNANYVNRGIKGQTSADMLLRFRQDVINLHPRAVVIMAGVNDIGEHNAGGDDNEQHKLENIESNIQTMAELAELHGIRPVFLSLLPVHFYTVLSKFRNLIPTNLIVEQNLWLKSYCEQHHYQYIDLYGAMLDNGGMLRRDFSEDGVHPNDAGYAVTAQIFSKEFHL
jgi:lysophospholipase L1-like esterase